jgi:hypothetical protein
LGLLLTVIGLPSHSRIVPDGNRGLGEQKPQPRVAIVPTSMGGMAVGTF